MNIPPPNAEYIERQYKELSKSGRVRLLRYLKFLLYEEMSEKIEECNREIKTLVKKILKEV